MDRFQGRRGASIRPRRFAHEPRRGCDGDQAGPGADPCRRSHRGDQRREDGQFLRVTAPAEPRTDNFHSLDVDRVAFSCAEVEGTLDVEFSYREGVHLEPIRADIGDPYFESFQADTMRPVEMAAEKLRALVQRQRGTDLADCVLLEQLSQGGELHLLPGARAKKFKLVRDGVGPDHVRERIDALADRYEIDVRAVDLDAPDYATARAAAFRLVRAAWA